MLYVRTHIDTITPSIQHNAAIFVFDGTFPMFTHQYIGCILNIDAVEES